MIQRVSLGFRKRLVKEALPGPFSSPREMPRRNLCGKTPAVPQMLALEVSRICFNRSAKLRQPRRTDQPRWPAQTVGMTWDILA
jgi:hypothetical protein